LHTVPFVQSVDARHATQRPSVGSQTGFGAAHPLAQLGPPLPAVPVAPPFGVPAFDAPPLADDPPLPEVFPATPAPPSWAVPEVFDVSLPPHAAAKIRVPDRANTETIRPREQAKSMGELL
jgi:hypothetical protein